MKPQDILVTLKILASEWPGSFAALAEAVSLSVSEAHAAVQRARLAGLMQGNSPNKSALAEFLIHGIKYTFPARWGAITRGLPTSYAAPPLNLEFPVFSEDDIPVWPDPNGEHRGYELKPLCRSAPQAAQRDRKLYEWLALADALRAGRARERELAAKIVRQRLGYHET